MSTIRNYINKLTKFQKIISLIAILGISLLLIIGIPTLARFKNRVTNDVTVWDGSIASSYKSGTGTQGDPYIISNGSQLAYFYTELLIDDYENKYFKLSNDIMLNEGVFDYNEIDGITYTLDNIIYYIDEYTNKYYDNLGRNGTEIGEVNLFNALDGFKGHMDGNSYTIYGLYMSDIIREEMALFTNLNGDIENLYVQNAFIEGGLYSGGISSIATNASIKNVVFNGFVFGRKDDLGKEINIDISKSPINMTDEQVTEYIDLANTVPFYGSNITSTSITGSYVINGATDADTLIKISGQVVSGGSFNINLGTSILDNVSILTQVNSQTGATLTLSNIEYNINYEYAVASGICAYCKNTTIENSINKANIYGHTISGGIVGVTTSATVINKVYNTGYIKSNNISGGLVGVIEKSPSNVTISKSYNSGLISGTNNGGLIGIIKSNSGQIYINNSFNTNSFNIGTIISTTVNLNGVYYLSGNTPLNSGVYSGSFSEISLENLKNKTFLTNNLGYIEFKNYTDLETNVDNVWVYEDGMLPILFIDDITNPIATIYSSVYSWNNLSDELSTFNISSSIIFKIESSDPFKPIKNTYYYISESSAPLSKIELDAISSWQTYSDVVQISDEGSYVIYAKVVDYDDNITYLNTDLLVLDFSNSLVDLTMENYKWSNIRSNLDYVSIDSSKKLTIDTKDNLSKINKLEYYISDEVLSINSLNNLQSNNWVEYLNEISLNEEDFNIVYIKITDENDNVTYINSDYIYINGYSQDLIIGRNQNSYITTDNYVTSKSTITLNMTYEGNILDYSSTDSHNIISNILLPQGTKITLIDKVKNKVYEYKVNTSEDIYGYDDSCEIENEDCEKTAKYPFALFKEVGKSSVANFIENNYYNQSKVTEDFVAVFDFSSSNISSNYENVKIYFELRNSSNNLIRPTLLNSIEKFNIVSNISSENSSATLDISTTYTGSGIVYNGDSTTNINIVSGLEYKYINSYKIIDTTYENKEIGLSIKMVDSNGVTIDKKYLNNMIFKVGDKLYYPGNDNIVRINFNEGFNEVNKNLTITTYENNNNLEDGTYYLKITNYVSLDGYYYSELNPEEISVHVLVTNTYQNSSYGFSVLMNEENRILNKEDGDLSVSFDVSQNGNLSNPNIRIALYKKDELTAYNQEYSIVDLANYISDELSEYSTNVYYLSQNPDEENNFDINFITSNFDNGGYKLMFYLYDGVKRVGAIEKNFIVK